MRFPSEKPEHERLFSELIAISKKEIDNEEKDKLSYDIIKKLAEEGSPRGNYLFAVNCYLEEEDGDNKDEFFSAINKALKAKYPLAEGLISRYLWSLQDMDALYDISFSAKEETAPILFNQGCFYCGYHQTSRKIKINYQKALKCLYNSISLFNDYDKETKNPKGVKDFLYEKNLSFNPDYYQEVSAVAYPIIMIIYEILDDKDNKQKYISAYNDAQKYGNANIKYRSARVYASDCMNNVMGMYSLKTVNQLMEVIDTRYGELSDAEREDLEENYNQIWEMYDEFYESEMERQREVNSQVLVTNSEYARDETLSVSNVAKTAYNAFNKWANTPPPPKTEHYVEINCRKYRVNDFGELEDPSGGINRDYYFKHFTDGLSNDLYDRDGNIVGRFDNSGYFHPNN